MFSPRPPPETLPCRIGLCRPHHRCWSFLLESIKEDSLEGVGKRTWEGWSSPSIPWDCDISISVLLGGPAFTLPPHRGASHCNLANWTPPSDTTSPAGSTPGQLSPCCCFPSPRGQLFSERCISGLFPRSTSCVPDPLHSTLCLKPALWCLFF